MTTISNEYYPYPTIMKKLSSETFRLDSSFEINNWNSYKSIDKWRIIIQYLSSKYNLQLQMTNRHETDILLSFQNV